MKMMKSETIIERLRRVSATYKMYADASLANAKSFKLKSEHEHKFDRNYTEQNAEDDLLFSKECQQKAGSYWSFHNELELILKDYDLVIDYFI